MEFVLLEQDGLTQVCKVVEKIFSRQERPLQKSQSSIF